LGFTGEKTLAGLLCVFNGSLLPSGPCLADLIYILSNCLSKKILFYQIMQGEHNSSIVNIVGGTMMSDEDQICTGQVR
jgi:hypothetical protein